MDVKKILGNNVKKYRKALGLTQTEFAERLNIDQKHMSFIENGNSFPSAKLLEKIADFLNIRLRDLFNYEQAPDREQMKIDIINSLDTASEEDISKIHNYIGYICINKK